jgi:hypothetical protein
MSTHRAALDRLGRAFSLLLSPVWAGCSADAIDLEQFTEDLCAGGAYRMLDAVEPDAPVEYVELRSAQSYSWEEEPTWSAKRILDASGDPCGGASDRPACEAALEALPLQSEFVRYGFDAGEEHFSLAYSRGDAVGSVGTHAELDAFLGTIDAVGDAALLATLHGHSLVCDDENDAGVRGEGFVLHTRSGGGCGQGDDIEEHVLLVHPDGRIEVIQTVLIEKGEPGCAVGRLPAGLCRRIARRRPGNPVGAFFGEVARLEAAAVSAFAQLRSELAVHGAPASLVSSAGIAIGEERRHARSTARLARRHGGRPLAPRVAPTRPRALVDVALDNAAEGCVRETYGALVAALQARRAGDPAVRRAMARIAREELRHAALSWDLAAWAQARLRVDQRRRVRRATLAAVDRLEDELTRPEHPAVCSVAGMPEPDQARRLFTGLRDRMIAAC